MSALTLGGRMDMVEHKVDVNGSQMVLALDNYYTKAEIDALFVTNRVIDYDSGTDVELADTDPDLFNVGMSGTNGRDGTGLNTGGTTNQILIKNDENDYNTSWSDLKTINGKSLLGVGDLRAEIEAIVLAMSIAL